MEVTQQSDHFHRVKSAAGGDERIKRAYNQLEDADAKRAHNWLSSDDYSAEK